MDLNKLIGDVLARSSSRQSDVYEEGLLGASLRQVSLNLGAFRQLSLLCFCCHKSDPTSKFCSTLKFACRYSVLVALPCMYLIALCDTNTSLLLVVLLQIGLAMVALPLDALLFS